MIKTKHRLITCIIAIYCTASGISYAAPTCRTGTCVGKQWLEDKQTFQCTGSCTCNTVTYVCAGGGSGLLGCFNDSDCGTGYICQNYNCVACTGCSDCNNVSWTAYSTGYQRQTNATCNCNTCTKTYTYRCAPGYYGTTSNGTSGCSRCPTENNITGTSAAGATARTSCYIASGTSFNETSGQGTYAGNSYYCN